MMEYDKVYASNSKRLHERKHDIDVMRIISTLGVIGIHASSGVLQQFCTFAVPLFVMISGVLWLDDKIIVSAEKIWKKNIFRIVTAFLFWSLVYALLEPVDGMTVKSFIYKWITGHYHMWFCYMIIGIYMFVPVIRKLKEDVSLYFYFLSLSGIIMVIIPSMLKISAIAPLEYNADLLFYKIGVGFIFYFMLGDFLYHKEIKPTYRKLLYIGGMISFGVMNSDIWSVNDFDIFMVIYVSAIFVSVKELMNRLKIKGMFCYILQHVSNLCFGIYMIHALILETINKVFISQTVFMDILTILIVFVFSLSIVHVINKIPWLKKYII